MKMKQNRKKIQQNKKDIYILEIKTINPYLKPRILPKRRKHPRMEESSQD